LYPKQKTKSKIMAQKDPAFLFYSQDFYVGTAFLTHTQVGKYIRLICAQHQHGRLNEERVIQICGDLDEAVLEKFQKDENGFYYNVRLETEIEKRKRFSESRRNNIKKRWDTSVVQVNNTSNTSEYTSELHMKNTSNTYGDTSVIHMENENENRNISLESSNNSEKENSKRKRKTFIPPTVEEVVDFVVSKGFDQQLGRNAWEYYAVADWKDAKGDQVLNWKQKLIAGWLKNAQKGGKIQLSNENDVNIPGYIKEFHNSPLMKREVINGHWEYKSAPIGFKS
jgi:hypothetical protein